MQDQIQSYLREVMRRSGLSRLEKADWIEEMTGHLHDEAAEFMRRGYGEDEATALALKEFGEPAVLRRKISRETFGLSVPAILLSTAVCFVLFCVDCSILSIAVRLRQPSIYTSNLASMLWAALTSPSLTAGLCLSFLSLLKTRRRADRMAILSTLAGFGLPWVLIRMPLSFEVNQLLFSFKDLYIIGPADGFLSAGIITVLLVGWGLVLFVWTQNRWLGLFPTLLSIVVGLCAVVVFPLINGFIRNMDGVTALFMLEAVAVRCVPVVLLVFIFKMIEAHRSAARLTS